MFLMARPLARGLAKAAIGLATVALPALGSAQTAGAGAPAAAPTKPATDATKAANQRLRDYLPFDDREDFEAAQRGFIARPDTLSITDAAGRVV
jgi:alkyl sulfatase BDS1-like metallo-beta-lactamase superfamily hydrolase